MIQNAFPDARFGVEYLVAEGEKVVGHWTMHATHRGEVLGLPATGRPVTMTGTDIVRWSDGQAVEVWHIEDILGMLQQLRVAPGTEHSGG